MEEITHEDWMKNPYPRMMLVWDDGEVDLHQKDYVVYIASDKELKEHNISYKVKTIRSCFNHCAEIEEPQFRRMTKRELSWWLRDHPEEHREWKNREAGFVYSTLSYQDKDENEPCGDIVIRSNGGEWHEPLVEVEE